MARERVAMSISQEFRSGVLSRIDVMVADVKKATARDGVEAITFETLDGTTIRIYGDEGFLDRLAGVALASTAVTA